MFKNYFIVAVRNFWRYKIFSLINIVGLAIGISASLVIYLIVSYDFSFDRFETDRNRIYRVVNQMHFPDNLFQNPGVPMPLPAAIKQQVTGIELAVPFHTGNGDITVSINTGSNKPAVFKKQPYIIYADNNYFKLLSYQWLAGAPQTSLNDPFTVVLTESRAKSYFPFKDVTQAMGQVITYNDSVKATVTGIVKDITETTDFIFKEFISYSTIENSGLKHNFSWGQWGSINSSSQFFIKLNSGVSPQQIEKQIEDIQKKNGKDAYLEMTYSLQPFNDIHFNPQYGAYGERQAHLPTLYGLMIFAAVILLLGCINFINLTTAHAAQRAKEIGIRKTMGASRPRLILQFFSETLLLTLLATMLSVILIPWLLKMFADFIPPAIHFEMLQQINVIIFIIALMFVVTLLSGFYPSLILSGYKPVSVLKNQSSANAPGTRKALLRKSLTVTQFIVAQVFIIGALVIGKQIEYSLNKDLGFNQTGVIIMRLPWGDPDTGDKGKVLLHQLQSIPGIARACLGGAPPANDGISIQTMKFNDGKKQIETTVELKYADADYFNLYKMKLIAGRFTKQSDSITEYAINESYARFLGFKNPVDAIGKFIGQDEAKTPIVGVLADFYSQSLHAPIKPLVYTAVNQSYNWFHILLQPQTGDNTWKKTIDQVQQYYRSVYPKEDFKYEFLDDKIASFYKSEQNTLSLLNWATGLAIFISCLGLLGLVIYTTNQRTKELGVRKVLGATVSQIVALISKDFIKLVLLAFVIAVPIAFWGMNKWLENFAYRTEMNWWIFVADGMLMILIALLTLAFQTIKAASANPVKSLRTE